MTLYSGARTTGLTKLDGPERTLDALIGTIVWVVGLVVGFLAIGALYEYGLAATAANPSDVEAMNFGLSVAAYGGGIIYGIATLIFLVRLASGRRSWRAPLWGGILVAAAVVVGYIIMVG